MSSSEKRLGIVAVLMAVCCAVLPLAGGLLAGGLAFGAGTISVIAGRGGVRRGAGIRAAQAPEQPMLSCSAIIRGGSGAAAVAARGGLGRRGVSGVLGRAPSQQ